VKQNNHLYDFTSHPAIPVGNLAFPHHHHLKSFSPQVPAQDNEMIAAIFPGKVIIVDNGKLS
jgi:hypothetical protein